MSLRASIPTIVSKTSLGKCSRLGDMEAGRPNLRRRVLWNGIEGEGAVRVGRGSTFVQMQCIRTVRFAVQRRG
jgi:hypothetical protein